MPKSGGLRVLKRCKHIIGAGMSPEKLDAVAVITVQTLPGKEHRGREIDEVHSVCAYCCSFIYVSLQRASDSAAPLSGRPS